MGDEMVKLFRIELGMVEDGLVLKGAYTVLGKLVADAEPELAELIQQLTLATTKVMGVRIGSDKAEFRGPGTKTPAMKEYLASIGATPVKEAGDEQENLRDAGMSKEAGVHPVPQGVGD